jgi:hypothetical protein
MQNLEWANYSSLFCFFSSREKKHLKVLDDTIQNFKTFIFLNKHILESLTIIILNMSDNRKYTILLKCVFVEDSSRT